MRIKRRVKDDDPAPSPYSAGDPDWSKAKELERRPCGIPGRDDTCAVVDAALKPWARSNSNAVIRMVKGSERMLLDLENGLLLSLQMIEIIDNQRGGYQSEATYTLKRLGLGTPKDPNLFKLPSDGMHEVKELSRWNASTIKKRLGGNPAPELEATDVLGQTVTLSNFKGKTVLLDFWTTWCPPCRADAPALDKLYSKYGAEDLMIVGISVSEDRPVVEKFLKEHPHKFPILLTSENEMPRAYQVAVFPTYIVIDRNGDVVSAVEGEKGFSELRKLLMKAGLEVD